MNILSPKQILAKIQQEAKLAVKAKTVEELLDHIKLAEGYAFDYIMLTNIEKC